MFCSNCGAKSDGGNFCTNCGTSLQALAPSAEQQPRKKSRAPLIAIVAVVCVGLIAGLAIGIPWAYNQFASPNVPTPSPTAAVTPTATPTPTVSQTTDIPALSWENGTKEVWRSSDDNQYIHFVEFSQSVWLAYGFGFNYGHGWSDDAPIVAVDPATGEILWKSLIKGQCADQPTDSGVLVCVEGAFDQLSVHYRDAVTGEQLREVSSASWGWPDGMMPVLVTAVGDDVIIAGATLLTDEPILYRVDIVRISANGSVVWKTSEPEVDEYRLSEATIRHGVLSIPPLLIDIATGDSLLGAGGFPAESYGFLAENVLHGNVDSWTAITFPDGTTGTVLDFDDKRFDEVNLVEGMAGQPLLLLQMASDCSIQAINPTLGAQNVWSEPVQSSESCEDDYAGVEASTKGQYLTLRYHSGQVMLLDISSGDIVWRVDLGLDFGGYYTYLGVLSDGSVILNSDDDGKKDVPEFKLLAASDGEILAESHGFISPVLDGRGIFVYGENGLSLLVPA
ncbi:MAG: PQQ-binding-like beta-propeller repeat protein [Propionibacteriaceae bacterium]|nr:PQQ-binding-like beta-propeller repeat protein [Propionibacteriaceae bacterium]